MNNIYEYVTTEETAYQTTGVTVAGNWVWSMYDHCNYSLLMKNSQFPQTATKLGDRPVKNIIRPILNVAYRSEGFDVKDIEPYVNNPEDYYKSFFVRKFHARWARKHDLDTAIDESVETYIDYGGVLVKKVKGACPEIVSWQQIAFCDQTDILSGTIALKHEYSIDQLLDEGARLGWDKASIEKAVQSAREEKSNNQAFDNSSQTPTKYIDVYEVHGTFPDSWLSKSGEPDLSRETYSKQIHLITYVRDEQTNKVGLTLFKGKESTPIFKFLSRDKIFGRALGFGGVEELFEPQIWTNFNMLHIQNMLKEASKVIQVTTDSSFTTKNNTKNTKGGEVFVLEEGKTINQLNTQPINIALFEKATQEWEIHARTTGSANDAQLGVSPASGTPFALQNLVTSTGQGIHEYRRGKIATFWAEIYRDWILEDLVAEINKGNEWVDELTLEEMQHLSQTVMNNAFNDYIIQKILKGEGVTSDELKPLQDQFLTEFKKSSKKFLTTIKGEFKDIPVDVEVNIAGKQKDLSKLDEKLTNVFRTVIGNPYILQSPQIAKIFNQIVEAAGLDPIDLSGFNVPPLPARRITESIDYADLQPNAQQAMLETAGINVQASPSPQTQLPVKT